MSRAVFEAVPNKGVKPADYYLSKKGNEIWWKVGGDIWWKVGGIWYRMFPDGSCGLCTKSVGDAFGTPDSRPHEYEPRYGAFTITINPDEED